jgi:hypothetical protein
MMRAKWGATQAGCDLGVAQNTNARPPNGAGRSRATMRLLNRSGLPGQHIFTEKHLTSSEIQARCLVSRSKFEGRLPEAFARRERERHLRAGDTQPRPRAVLGQPRRPLGVGLVRPPSKA